MRVVRPTDRELTNVVTRGKSLLAILLPRGRGAESVHSTPLPNDARVSGRLDSPDALPRLALEKVLRCNVQSAEKSAV